MLSTSIFLKKLKLTAINEKGIVLDKTKTFELMLNPEFFEIRSKINYAKVQAGTSPKYKDQPPKEIILPAFILDVTGAVPYTLSALFGTLEDAIAQLENVIYTVVGTKHRPNYILIEWGSLSYKAQLKSMDVKYTLFAENGDPLRAEVKLTLQEYQTAEEKAAKEKKSSPDLTHLVEVKDGDTLPLMCSRVYNDCSYYREVAEVNELDDFRHLTPGTFLYFPPLVD